MTPKNQVISLVSKVREKAKDFLENEMETYGIEGLVTSHGSILSVLYQNNGKLTMRQITDLVNRSKSTVTQLVDKLVLFGYVEKQSCEDDGRVTFITLTEKAWNIECQFKEISEKLIETAFRNFSADEIVTFLRLMDKMRDNF